MGFEYRYDAVVAGAGIAGIAAALQLARDGKKVALLEKTVFPGGLATTGLINIYLPICDGNGTQVSKGIAEELLRRTMDYGPGRIPEGWDRAKAAEEKRRFVSRFYSPASYILALDEVLETAGVEVWLDTLVADPIVESGRVTGLFVETKAGRGEIFGKVVVDATGDADVVARAGGAVAEGGNWRSMWALEFSGRKAKEALEAGDGTIACRPAVLGDGSDGAGKRTSEKPFPTLTERSVSEFVLAGRGLLRERLRKAWARPDAESRETHFPILLPAMAQFRTTRRIVGKAELNDANAIAPSADSIGLAAEWRRAGPVMEIPYGTLLPAELRGVLTAGRCISSTGDAWEITRVIPAAAVTGQAAGVAASIAIDAGKLPDEIDAAAIQSKLKKLGVPVRRTEVGLAE